jgi:formylmethanofuran dehydrogenase subunit B
VATPGVDVAGHLFRADGVVLLPLHAARSTALPTAAQVLAGLHAAMAQEVAA